MDTFTQVKGGDRTWSFAGIREGSVQVAHADFGLQTHPGHW